MVPPISRGGAFGRVTTALDRLSIPIVALGLLLATMHQSSLGTLMLLAGSRLHPLWRTPNPAAAVPDLVHRDGLRGRRVRIGADERRTTPA